MTIEQRDNKLEKQFDNLNKAFLQAQRNQVPITAKVDDSANQIINLTPYTETKVGYYGETEKIFYDVPDGNVTVFGLKEYSMNRIANMIVLTFQPLLSSVNITISIS